MATPSDAGVLYLRRLLRDLVALSGVPGAWVGREPSDIVADFADLLVALLEVDSAFVRLCDPKGGAVVETARGKPWPALLEWLGSDLSGGGPLLRSEVVPGISDGTRAGRGIVVPIGINAELGLVAAASDRPDFPGEIDQLLLSVAANHAATAFRMARLVEDHRGAEAALRDSERQLRRARDELEMRVAERTAELRGSERKFRDYAETASDWFWEIGSDYKFTLLTENAFGSDPADRIGTTCWDHALDHETEPEKWRMVRETLDARRPFRDFIYRAVGGNGAPMYVKASGKPVFDNDGKFRGYRGTGSDVTATMRAREEHEKLGQLESDLAHMNRLGIMGEQTASLVHEITQPIATARNHARAALNFLDREPPNLDKVREALAGVMGDADRAGEVIDRIRDHIRKAPPRTARFDLNHAIDEVIVLGRTAIARHGILVQTLLAEGLFPVRGDRVQLQQVILNLVLNAVEAMRSVEGARELLISTEQTQGNGVIVTVRDSGPGVDPEHVDRVFEAFYTTKPSGVGMGLSICRSIIQAHGGRLWVDADEPRGAVFRFTLPEAENELAKGAPPEGTAATARHQPVWEDNR